MIFDKNINLIWHIINKINFSYNNSDRYDLFQIGAIGLIKALKKFDADYDVKFSTFAFPYIVGEIKMFLRDNNTIKVSRTIKKNYMLISKLDSDMTLSQIEKETGLTSEEIVLALNSSKSIITDSTSFQENEEEGYAYNNIMSDDNVEEEVVKKVLIKEMLKKLDKDERKVIISRYFKDEKQDVISRALDMSQVKVSRIEKRALEKLRAIMT